MNTTLTWTGNMTMEATAEGQTVTMDAKKPIGGGSAQTPKELVAAGLGGCTGMDVLALMKKHKQPLEAFMLDVEIETSSGGSPVVFTKATLTFKAEGAVDPARLLEAVELSQTKYCGVSAMLAKAFPISYVVVLNGREVGRGVAAFGDA